VPTLNVSPVRLAIDPVSADIMHLAVAGWLPGSLISMRSQGDEAYTAFGGAGATSSKS
jgi:hypothetical protein